MKKLIKKLHWKLHWRLHWKLHSRLLTWLTVVEGRRAGGARGLPLVRVRVRADWHRQDVHHAGELSLSIGLGEKRRGEESAQMGTVGREELRGVVPLRRERRAVVCGTVALASRRSATATRTS